MEPLKLLNRSRYYAYAQLNCAHANISVFSADVNDQVLIRFNDVCSGSV